MPFVGTHRPRPETIVLRVSCQIGATRGRERMKRTTTVVEGKQGHDECINRVALRTVTACPKDSRDTVDL